MLAPAFSLNPATPVNVVAWIKMLQVLQDFGQTFYIRIAAFTTSFVLTVVLMVGFLVLSILINAANGTTAVMALVLFDVAAFLLLVIAMVMEGGACNQARQRHVSALLRNQVLAESVLSTSSRDLDPAVADDLQLSVGLLGAGASFVRQDTELHRVAILGFAAGGQFARFLLAIGLAGVAMALRQITGF